jgi:hypothetical protein
MLAPIHAPLSLEERRARLRGQGKSVLLIANAFSSLDPLTEAVCISSNDPAAVVIVILDDAAPTFNVAWRRLPLLIKARTAGPYFDSELSLGRGTEGKQNGANQRGNGRKHQKSWQGQLLRRYARRAVSQHEKLLERTCSTVAVGERAR